MLSDNERPVKLFILGATGRTGSQIVEQALARGHAVTAFVRSPGKRASRGPGLTVVEGDARDVAQLAAGMLGHDAVLSALGNTSVWKSTNLMRDTGRATVAAMHRAGVRRLIAVSTGLLFTEQKGALLWLLRTILRRNNEDLGAMEQIVEGSGVDWTIVRPPRLVQAPVRGFRSFETPEGTGRSLPYADLATFMLDEVRDRRFVRKHACIVGA